MIDRGAPSPGWYPDPDDTRWLRWWDGGAWTDDRAPRAAPPAPANVAPNGPRPVGEFIAGSFRAVGACVKPLALLAAVAIVPLVVALVLADAQLGFSDWLTEVVDTTQATDPGQELVLPQWDVNPAGVAVWAVAVAILYLFAYAVLPLVAVPLIDAGVRGGEADVDDAVRAGLRALPRAVGVALLSGLGVLAVLAVPIVVTVIVPPLGILLLLVSVPLLVYLAVRLLSLVQPLLVIEGRGLSLFGRSWELTAGFFWPVLGRSLLFGLIVGFASNLVTLPVQLIGAVDPAFATLLGLVVGAAAGAATGIVQVAGPVVIYRDLVDGPPDPLPPQVWGAPPS